jgi:hypothetical protein
MKIAAVAAALLALAACSGKPLESADNKAAQIDANEAKADAAIQTIVKVDGPGAVAPGVPISKPSPETTDPDALPVPMLGRWGLTVADCDVSNGAPRGLLTIAAKSLKFYDSTATIVSLDKPSQYAVTAGLSYADEGRKWTSVETLALVAGGTALVRTEQSPVHTLRYQRCR